MTGDEQANIIIRLTEKGWSNDEIVAFLGYVATHKPTEKELNDAIKDKRSS